ncbi:glycosyl hydrolase family 18 protein [Sulfobacillus thermosulfidooxidans]|uniref:glycosyl hydrolase family 18 protein n=1 Tax=Sulfobacillus thermosulfidooxidans TaxID=28034 RepID=UPI00096BB3D9|nr:glycosyl hydrolase family 18 protein [Sulfobacillus thermosulfidooxidans]OLZ12299.1 hypothetical protein BFX05_00935 [Sulfobacillus thermosulfidooxidans]OLZ12920.1 hypothetical protein BFX06_10120 [Sulfobacillus thermosulfidooxidans]OLZ21721.1 hypothetical protein BFX07_12955 [Sulfobacillus thermosulfidooxidans]
MQYYQSRRYRKRSKVSTLLGLSLLFTGSLTLLNNHDAKAFSLNHIQYVRLANTMPVFVLSHKTLYHVPNPATFFALGGSWSNVESLSSLSGDSLGLPMVVPYPSGTLLKTYNAPTVYLVVHGILRPIATAQVFNQMDLNWNAIHVIPQLMNNWPVGSTITRPISYWPSGTVLRQSGHPQVYEVEDGTLSHIISPTLFHQLGYHWSDVKIVSQLPYPIGPAMTKPLREYPTGTILQLDGHRAVYVDEEGTLRHIPNPTIFHELGYHFSEIIHVSNFGGNTMGPPLGSTTIPGDPSSSPSPSQPPSSSSPTPPLSAFLSMGYGYYADNEPNGPTNSSYLDLLQHANALSVINPVWYFVQPSSQGGWMVNDWTRSIPTINDEKNVQVVTKAAHNQGVLVMPSVGIYYNPSSGPITTPAEQKQLVQQLVAIVQKNDYDGLTIDFESQGSGNLSVSAASTQYTQFIQQLGTALHALGKKLMIAVYASPYPSTIYNYQALAPYVNWINIMAYPEHNSSTPAGPTQGFPWLENIVHNALATGVNPSQIILGVAPYGHSWTYTNSGYTGNTYESNRTIKNYIESHNIVPLWDATEKAIVFTTGPLAQTPPAPLSYNVNQSSPAVANLQAILNVALLQYASTYHLPAPPLLWANGYYDSETSRAVAMFQQDFHVKDAQSGIYDAQTAQVLAQVISQYHIGETQWWDQTSRSFADLLKLALQDHLAGVASWRLPFETTNYWSTLTSLTSIWKP